MDSLNMVVMSSENRSRLQQLARDLRIPVQNCRPRLIRSKTTPTSTTEGDIQSTKDLLLQRRQTDPNYKRPSLLQRTLSNDSKRPRFGYKEINRALNDLVLSEGSP